jgi:hypothetical protein
MRFKQATIILIMMKIGTVAKGVVRILNKPNVFIIKPINIKKARLSPTDKTTVSVRCGLSILNTLRRRNPGINTRKIKPKTCRTKAISKIIEKQTIA